jgi:hypothetical protein
MFLDAARALAHLVSQADLDLGAVYPPLTRIRDCSHAVACAVIRRAVSEGHAAPGILSGLEETVSRAMWFPTYRPIPAVRVAVARGVTSSCTKAAEDLSLTNRERRRGFGLLSRVD